MVKRPIHSAILATCSVFSGVAVAASAPATYPVTIAAVAQAAIAQYPDLADAEIAMLAAPRASDATPQLSVDKPEPWPGAPGRERMKVSCSGNACIPFYVEVHTVASMAAPVTMREAALRVPASPSSMTTTAARPDANPQHRPMLRTGDHAELLIDSGRLHLRVPVTCLEAGDIGSTIRVAGPNHRAVFTAQVVDKFTLRGSL